MNDLMSNPIVMVALVFVAFMVFSRLMGGKRVNGKEARSLVEQGALLVDVRTVGEFGARHIDGAKNIPLSDIGRRLKDIPKNKPVVLYCRSGSRSGQAKRLLKSKGYDPENLHNLGPMGAW